MRSTAKSLTLRTFTVALLAGALVLASCGSGDESVEADTSTEVTESSPAAAPEGDTAEGDTAEEDADEGQADESAAGGNDVYPDVQQSIGATGVFEISLDEGEVVAHTGTCDMWTDEVSYYLDFMGDTAEMTLHVLTTDDPDVAWSGNIVEGAVVTPTFTGIEAAEVSFDAPNVATGGGNGFQADGSVVDIAWTFTCG